MFNGEMEAEAPTYLFDLTRYYKIWFSANSEQFLGIEDQLRFIGMREENPREQLHFIYSRVCLTPKAGDELKVFCKQYNIIPIAFEDLEAILAHEQDKALYMIAKQELDNCINGKEGNMASASDCVRLLVPIIEQYGIYSDFDVRSCLAKLKAQYVTLRGPLLFPAEIMMLSQHAAILSPNSDFFSCSLDQNNRKNLSHDALEAIRRLQNIILKKYQSPFCSEKLFGLTKLSDLQACLKLPQIFINFHAFYTNNPSIYDFRAYVKGLPESAAKTFLTRVSVINMSGPGTYPFLFSHLFPKGESEPSALMPYKDKKWLPFLALYERCGIGFYDPIYDAIDSKNSIVKAMASSSNGSSKNGAEFSWTKEGMKEKQKREQQMVYSALKIQGFWRNKMKESCYLLYKEVKTLNSIVAIHDNIKILEPIKQNKIALALRCACAGIHLDAVKLLVTYQQKHPFNVNEASASDSNTALDWVIKAKTDNDAEKEEQQIIIRLLKSIGAKTAKELVVVQDKKQGTVQTRCMVM